MGWPTYLLVIDPEGEFEVVGETSNSEYDELQFWDVKSFPSPLTSASLAMRSLS